MAFMVLGLSILSILSFRSQALHKFCYRIITLGIATAIATIVTYVVMTASCKSKLDEVYSITKNQDILFIGSSQIGCAVLESPEYHNKVIWYMTSTIPTFVIHFKELLRRGQLSNVRKLIVNFNSQSIEATRQEWFQLITHRAFPLFWRYLGDYPAGYFAFISYSVSHCPDVMSFTIKDTPVDHRSISERGEDWYNGFIADVKNDVKSRNLADVLPHTEQILCKAIDELYGLAKENGIELIVVEMPVIEAVAISLPIEHRELLSRINGHIEGLGIRRIVLDSFSDQYFFDSVHMTSAGRSIFMEKLYKAIGEQKKIKID